MHGHEPQGAGARGSRAGLEGKGQHGHHSGHDGQDRGLDGRRRVDAHTKDAFGRFLLGVGARLAIGRPQVVRGIDGHTVQAAHKVRAWASQGTAGVDGGLRGPEK